MMTMIACTRCGWTRIVTPINPPNARADLEWGIRRRNRLGRCPRCGDINLDVERRDIYGRVELRSI